MAVAFRPSSKPNSGLQSRYSCLARFHSQSSWRRMGIGCRELLWGQFFEIWEARSCHETRNVPIM